jgi:hypothetical protein
LEEIEYEPPLNGKIAVPIAPLFTSSTPPMMAPAPFAEKLPTRAKNPPESCPVIVNA